ncbi:transcriptional regulator (TetR family) protein [Indibacter alkaliphilus LW1]|jgi:AcrR family transcriptional regulator|uniref:Transcriptional regulator (TetR family) protein n=1 Tax=Indibacter alkaliphilus (strain CCUG 57479 / KCTC 22604 / LW1) TaxID=1189612 RepID=S2D9J1_INDAL|nr:TetR/AcrR family transcriptional regulator [Indibacter alkaliphilus]EOZ95534.1 transcriptional regulator (TetR family) protein [Indibacter alkaliphilus LW1]
MSKKADIENKILEVAYSLFLKQGYKNTTMDDIAQELAMSKKTLYKYFPGKMELLSATFDRLKTSLAIKVQTLLDNKYIPFAAKLKSLLTVVATDLAPINPDLLEDLRDHAPEIWKELQDYIRESAYLRFQKLIQEGMEKGYVASHVNISLVVFMYASAIQSLIDPKFLSQFPKEMRESMGLKTSEIYDQAIQIIYQGILTDEAKEEYQQT